MQELQSGAPTIIHLFFLKKHFVWLANYRFRLGEISEIDGSAGRACQPGPFKSAGQAQTSRQSHPGHEKLPAWPDVAAGETRRIRRDFCASQGAENAHEQQHDPAVARSSKAADAPKKRVLYLYDRNVQKQLKMVWRKSWILLRSTKTSHIPKMVPQYHCKESRREAQQELDVYVVELEQQNCKTQPHAGGRKEYDRLHRASALHTKTSAENGQKFHFTEEVSVENATSYG
eukprot:s734_g3.t1